MKVGKKCPKLKGIKRGSIVCYFCPYLDVDNYLSLRKLKGEL